MYTYMCGGFNLVSSILREEIFDKREVNGDGISK